MGLISRVSSRTYRYRNSDMAETFKKNVVIDAQDHLAGRLCAVVAKELLRGNHVTIVRCEGVFITGNFYRNKLIMLEKINHRTATNPKDGPFHYRAPSMMIKRMTRGMLPNKVGRGQRALERLQCFDRCPAAKSRLSDASVTKLAGNTRTSSSDLKPSEWPTLQSGTNTVKPRRPRGHKPPPPSPQRPQRSCRARRHGLLNQTRRLMAVTDDVV